MVTKFSPHVRDTPSVLLTSLCTVECSSNRSGVLCVYPFPELGYGGTNRPRRSVVRLYSTVRRLKFHPLLPRDTGVFREGQWTVDPIRSTTLHYSESTGRPLTRTTPSFPRLRSPPHRSVPSKVPVDSVAPVSSSVLRPPSNKRRHLKRRVFRVVLLKGCDPSPVRQYRSPRPPWDPVHL